MKIINLNEARGDNIRFQDEFSKYLTQIIKNNVEEYNLTAVRVLCILANKKYNIELNPDDYSIHHILGTHKKPTADDLYLIKKGLHISSQNKIYLKVLDWLKEKYPDVQFKYQFDFKEFFDGKEGLPGELTQKYLDELANPDNYQGNQYDAIKVSDLVK